MPFDKIADRKIREGMAQGKFDGLPHGRRIDLEDYFKLPPDLRMAYSVLKSAGCLPEEVERLNEVARLERELAIADDEASRRTIRARLTAARLQLDLLLERMRREQRAPGG